MSWKNTGSKPFHVREMNDIGHVAFATIADSLEGLETGKLETDDDKQITSNKAIVS